MGILLRCALAASVFSVVVHTANAQGGTSDVIATLQVNKGVVMISTGNEYVSAVSGQRLVKAERVMIAQDGSATITYRDDCKRVLDTPGVYTVDGICSAGGWSGLGVAAAVVAGGVAVGVVVDNLNHNDQPQNPVSR